MGGKGGRSTTIQQPDPIDPGQAMGEYLFGKGFGNYRGITDSRLQDRLIASERKYRPQYTALELADIGVMARGIEGGTPNPEYQQLEAQLAGLEAGAAVDASSAGDSSQTSKELEAAALKLYPGAGPYDFGRMRGAGRQRSDYNKSQSKNRDAFISGVNSGKGDPAAARAAKIAQVKAQLRQTPATLDGTPGLFDLLEEQTTRAGALQREQLGLQRESDVGALQRFAPQVVEAYRDADPYSTEIAESMSRKAMGQLTPEEERNIQQRSRQASLSRGRISDSSSIAAEALGRSDYTSQFAQPAFGMNRQLAGDVGMTILGRPSAAVGLGGQMLGQAQQGAAGPMGPQLFDPNVGINMAMQEQSNQVSLLGAQAQADASRSAGKSQMMGSIGAAAIGAI